MARRIGHAAPETTPILRIGGFTRLTTIDYPGELAAIVFCQGCPWRCRYCYNTDLLDARTDGLIPWSDIRGFLEQRIGLLDGVVFSGGEPTAQGALDAVMQETAIKVNERLDRRGKTLDGIEPAELGDILMDVTSRIGCNKNNEKPKP